jgi:hypothetical protein
VLIKVLKKSPFRLYSDGHPITYNTCHYADGPLLNLFHSLANIGRMLPATQIEERLRVGNGRMHLNCVCGREEQFLQRRHHRVGFSKAQCSFLDKVKDLPIK